MVVSSCERQGETMEPVALIVTALTAKAAGSKAVERAASVLKTQVSRLLARQPNAEYVLTRHESEPEIWRAPLEHELRKAGAAENPDVLSAAQTLMSLVDEEGTRGGKYIVSVQSSQGVQVGDSNTQVNYFTFHPARDEAGS